MVWVCGDSWRGPAGAAGKGRVHWDGAARRRRGNRCCRCCWHCWWGSVPSVFGAEDPTGDETGEGSDVSAALSFAVNCSLHCKTHGCAASVGLPPAHSRARCRHPTGMRMGMAPLKWHRGNGDHRALHIPSPALGLGPGQCPLAWEGCESAASPCKGVERFLHSPALDRAVPAFADNSGGEA